MAMCQKKSVETLARTLSVWPSSLTFNFRMHTKQPFLKLCARLIELLYAIPYYNLSNVIFEQDTKYFWMYCYEKKNVLCLLDIVLFYFQWINCAYYLFCSIILIQRILKIKFFFFLLHKSIWCWICLVENYWISK